MAANLRVTVPATSIGEARCRRRMVADAAYAGRHTELRLRGVHAKSGYGVRELAAAAVTERSGYGETAFGRHSYNTLYTVSTSGGEYAPFFSTSLLIVP